MVEAGPKVLVAGVGDVLVALAEGLKELSEERAEVGRNGGAAALGLHREDGSFEVIDALFDFFGGWVGLPVRLDVKLGKGAVSVPVAVVVPEGVMASEVVSQSRECI